MVGVHFGHDTAIGNNCIFANSALLGGHATVEDRAFVSGAVAVHQFCRIGRLAMVGGHARITQDVPPYMLIDGQTGCVVGLNVVGLRRGGYSSDAIAELKAAYRVIFRRGLPWAEVIETLGAEFPEGAVVQLRTFLQSGKRGPGAARSAERDAPAPCAGRRNRLFPSPRQGRLTPLSADTLC
jgi:UDP-N-acetylglucosamine acyltransferase